MDEDIKRTTGAGNTIPAAPRALAADQPTIAPASSLPTMMPASTGPIARVPVSALPTIAAGAAHLTEADAFIGQELCGYVIRRKLAEGGMGVVYEGVHSKIGRRGAIKVLKLELCRSDEVVERFHQEARAVNAIRHENIVDIYDFGRDPEGRVFFVMEYLEGEPLAGRLARGPLSWPEALPMLEQTLRALKAAHDKGFVHRDLKPDNIWLRDVDGKIQIKLLDFGIAKLVGSDSPREKLTRTGSVIGTPHYMSPEQINGSRDVDQRTDLYAMGVIIYEMFAGVTPFVGDTLQAIMTGHLFTEPPRLADLPANLGVPAPIAEIVDRMLVKDPAARYASVTDVLDDLRDVHRNRPPAVAETLRRSQPTRVPEQAPAPVRKPRSIARWTVGGIAVAALAGAGIALTRAPAPAPVVPPGPTPIIVAPKPLPPPTPPAPPPDSVLREHAITTMQTQLTDVVPHVRTYVADVAAAIRESALVGKLTDIAQSDLDAQVRGHAGYALGALGATSLAPVFAKQEATALAPLKVWYASALALLGDQRAVTRLVGYARSRDLDVAFPASLNLAEVSKPGDPRAIAALKAIAGREAELDKKEVPHAAVMILSKAAGLRDRTARDALYAALDDTRDDVRHAAAEGLARIGDDAGREVLRAAFASEGSPDQLASAVALVALGEYAGLDLMLAKLDDKEPDVRRLAARGLGDIGERTGLLRLDASVHDQDGMVRTAAAGAILAIVGLDPQVLAQASINWTKGAFDSRDWAVRRSAASVLADLPAKEAVPLLARAFADTNRDVRLTASRSAGKIKTREAAQQVVAVVETEADPQVKEQQVVALAQIGDPVAHDALERISSGPGRIGVMAAGALIAVGDAAGLTKLEAAITAVKADLRLAAVEAASVAHNAIVVPTLKIGLLDLVFNIRFTAAEGLAGYGAEKDNAVPVLKAALGSKDVSLVGRALAAVARFGEQLGGLSRSPADMVDAPDPRQRLAALPAVRALAVAERLPLLRRLAADPDLEVRRAVVDAIDDLAVVDHEPDQAARLCRPLINDPDPVVRAKASGQLSRIGPMRTTKLAAQPVPDPAIDSKREQAVSQKLADASAAAAEARTASEAVDQLAAEIETTIGAAADEAAVQHAKELQVRLKDAAGKLDASASKVFAITTAAGDTGGTSPSAPIAKLLADVRRIAGDTRASRHATADKAATLQVRIDKFRIEWTPGLQILFDSAKLHIDQADFQVAAAKLGEAARLIRRAGATNPGLDDLYGELYTGMARNTDNPADKRKQLLRAQAVYQRVEQTGTGARAQDAGEHLKAIAEELAQ